MKQNNINVKEFLNLKNKIMLKLILLLAVITGIYFRFKVLGTWLLVVDENYSIKSFENIGVWYSPV